MKRQNYGKVAVLMGGKSAERNISLESGQAVLDALKRCAVDAHGIDVDEHVLLRLKDEKFNCAFIALHGRGGEDGVIQGALEQIEIPYTGSGVLGSALAMDKCRSKALWKQYGLPTPDYEELSPQSDWDRVVDRLGFPLMVKPVREGSSIGASKVETREQLKAAWQCAYQYDKRVMAECWITGNEYTVPIVNGQVLPMIKLETEREFYDYVAKYEDSGTRYICPCGLSEQVMQRLHQVALDACEVLDISGWGRVDVMLGTDSQIWLIEVNTIPGMTSHSLVPMAAKQAGISFEQLVLKILDTSFVKTNHQDEVVT